MLPGGESDRLALPLRSRWSVLEQPCLRSPATNQSPAPGRTASGIHALADLPPVQITACGDGYYGTYPNCIPYNVDPLAYQEDPCYWDYYSYDCPGYVDPDDLGDGGYTYDWQPGDPGTPCDTGVPYVDDSVVNYGMAQLWKASNPDAPLSQKVEAGGWIVRRSDGSYYVYPWPGHGNNCGWNTEVPWPPEGKGAIVAFVHTHPYFTGNPIPVCDPNDATKIVGYVPYEGEPSDMDHATATSLGQQLGRPGALPGVILDKASTITFSDANSNNVIYRRCGF